SGGNSPKSVFELLAKEYTHAIDWTSVYFFFGDERYVLSNDPDSNALMAKEALFNPLNIQENQVFTVDTTLEVKMAAADYNKKIVQFFDGQKIAFDLVMLGLGDDAHTASLFPGTEVLNEEMSGVSHVYISEKDVFRITMTAQMINDANNIAFLVFGKNKAEAVQHVMEGEQKTSHYPAQLIDKKAEWFMDEAAAKLITV
ncbi:MAG: 6-phosphogluconolactonase, partial [Spirosomataceae bacterium]